MTKKRLPLTVIGGFLGAGKTTLLNRWLHDARGVRMAVLVNDFGAINIDAGLIEASSGDTVALTNGCVCCQIGDDLTSALIRVLDTTPPFDAVVVEASGVSDPWRIAQMGRADPGLSLDGVIVLVDASAALAQSRDPLLADTLERQLKAADLIVVNHCDRAANDERARVRDWITSVAGATPQFETTQAQVPLPMLSGLALPDMQQAATPASAHRDPHEHADGAHEHGDPAHGALFDTWSCRPARVFSSTALRAWLAEPPPGILRLKGVLRTGAQDSDSTWSELQFAGRHGTLRTAPAPAAGPALVAIGLRGRLPVAALSALFDTPG
ncbi:CobW family GTP-binding protein [Polaromonas sp. C04]|uniref:CobW family GTP-binding protein n=1 Tax=Polaromonas sp. C04 TaxID=1945857 RepID=UPI000987C202|nr:CobW family GTP-binding protein [Polaromonas sp. C04]OOG50532.1 cobalamin biosynthesis protein P47K [Polaromonas sp. C04]